MAQTVGQAHQVVANVGVGDGVVARPLDHQSLPVDRRGQVGHRVCVDHGRKSHVPKRRNRPEPEQEAFALSRAVRSQRPVWLM